MGLILRSRLQRALRGGNEVGRRWVPASARTTEGREDGFPPPREQRRWSQALRGGNEVGRRMGSRLREDNGGGRDDGFMALRGGNGSGEEMGPRIREDNGGGRRMGSRLRGNNGGGAGR